MASSSKQLVTKAMAAGYKVSQTVYKLCRRCGKKTVITFTKEGETTPMYACFNCGHVLTGIVDTPNTVNDVSYSPVNIVLYHDMYYVWYKTNTSGKACLIDSNGTKYSGTPDPRKLKVIKEIPTVKYKNNRYFNTKMGVFSATTGNYIIAPQILMLFVAPHKPSVCCE